VKTIAILGPDVEKALRDANTALLALPTGAEQTWTLPPGAFAITKAL